MAKAPFVAMLTDLRKDDRVEVIAEIAGLDTDQVLGRLFRLWAWCADRKLADAPDDCEGYAVPEAVIRKFFGPRGVEAMLGDGCDELAMAARRPDGLLYLRGTSETVARLRRLKVSATTGGEARHESGERDQHGRFVGQHTNSPAGLQPVASHAPAESSVIPQATVHSPEEEDLGPDSGLAEPGDPPATPSLVLVAEPTAKKPRKKAKHDLPDGWEPSARQRDACRQTGLDLEDQVRRFKNHHVARGNQFADWSRAFDTWLDNAPRFGGGSRAGPGGREPDPPRKVQTLA